MDFKKMELSELASLVKVSLKEPGIGKFITSVIKMINRNCYVMSKKKELFLLI
jgi:hypothetical protein